MPLRTLGVLGRRGKLATGYVPRVMDVALRTLADAGLALEAAEEALAAGEPSTAASHLEEVDAALASVREEWPSLPAAGRAVVGPAGKQVAERRAALAKRLPKRRALSDGTPERDDEQDTPPGMADPA